MEYLMTYGWAILLIAVVLSVLFSMGLFSGNNITNNVCIASPGFLCTGAIYEHSNANIIVTVGQNTGTSWTSANFVFVPEGTPMNNGLPAISFNSAPANTELATQGLTSGGKETVYLPVNGIAANVNVGTVVLGTIWVEYSYTSTSGPYYSQIATLNLKAS